MSSLCIAIRSVYGGLYNIYVMTVRVVRSSLATAVTGTLVALATNSHLHVVTQLVLLCFPSGNVSYFIVHVPCLHGSIRYAIGVEVERRRVMAFCIASSGRR